MIFPKNWLTQNNRERKHNDLKLQQWMDQKEAELIGIEHSLQLVKQQIEQLDGRIEDERRVLADMNALIRFFRRRSCMRVLDELVAELATAREQQSVLEEDRLALIGRRPPDAAGLGRDAKRSINVMVISYAQQLFRQLADDEVAGFAKDTSEKSAGAVNYGDRQYCEALLVRIENANLRLDNIGNEAAVVHKRAKMISRYISYTGESDSMPVAGSVPLIWRLSDNSAPEQIDENILAGNYWGINGILID